MANTFLHKHYVVTASMADAYVCPGSTVAIIFSMQTANVDGANSADITVQTETANASGVYVTVMNTIPVPPDTTLDFPGKLVLVAGEALQAQASAANDLEMTFAVLEFT